MVVIDGFKNRIICTLPVDLRPQVVLVVPALLEALFAPKRTSKPSQLA